MNALDVTVLGAGISGLTVADRLAARGCHVTVVAAQPPQATTSALAAAVWFPTHVAPVERVTGWGRATFDALEAQARDGVPGVYLRESLNLYRQVPAEEPWMAAVGPIRAAQAGELPPGYAHGLRYVVPLVEMPVYLPWLVARLQAQGVAFQTRKITDLAELGDGVVVNCSGLAARDLAGDDDVHPVRGQIVRVVNPGLTMSVRDEQHPGGRAYVHPRQSDCILGGTLDSGAWDTTVDLGVAASIVERCRDLVPQLARVEVLEHVVGLRPARSAVRLEADADRPGLFHNYGHGGSGITLGWGCADEVAKLVLPEY